MWETTQQKAFLTELVGSYILVKPGNPPLFYQDPKFSFRETWTTDVTKAEGFTSRYQAQACLSQLPKQCRIAIVLSEQTYQLC